MDTCVAPAAGPTDTAVTTGETAPVDQVTDE